MTTPTTRRYPRSISDAFPQDRAYCVERYRKPRGGARWVALTVALLFGMLALSGCGGGDPLPEPERPTERNRGLV